MDKKLVENLCKSLQKIMTNYQLDMLTYGNAYFDLSDRKIELLDPKDTKKMEKIKNARVDIFVSSEKELQCKK